MSSEARPELPAQSLESSDPVVRQVLEKAKAQVGFIPNMYANMVNSPGVLDTCLDGYARFRSDSTFTPVEQEAVFLSSARRTASATARPTLPGGSEQLPRRRLQRPAGS